MYKAPLQALPQHSYASLVWVSCTSPCLVQIEQSDNFAEVLCGVACLQQQPAVMEGKADDLLHMVDDLLVANPAGLKQGQLIILWQLH